MEEEKNVHQANTRTVSETHQQSVGYTLDNIIHLIVQLQLGNKRVGDGGNYRHVLCSGRVFTRCTWRQVGVVTVLCKQRNGTYFYIQLKPDQPKPVEHVRIRQTLSFLIEGNRTRMQ